MTKNTALEFTFGRTVENMLATGAMVNSTVKAATSFLMGLNAWAFGRRASE